MEDLNEIYDMEDLLADAKENEGEKAKDYTIKDDASADWAIKIIKKEEATAERLVATIEQEISMLKTKAQRIKENATCGFLKKILCDYYETLPAEAKKLSKTQISYKLPSGSLVFKPESEDIIRDEEAIITALAQNDKTEFIKTKLSLDWAALKPLVEFRTEVLDLNMDIVDGIYVKDGVICQEADDKPLDEEAIVAGDLSIYENVPVLKGTNIVLNGIKLGVKPASFNVK